MEQAQGKISSAASDIYSLGIVPYEATTGNSFDGPDAVSVAIKQVKEPAKRRLPPSNPNIDPDLEDIIMVALSKDPARPLRHGQRHASH